MRDEFKNTENWSKRFLPHYSADHKLQMITYRLADSLPQEVLQKLEERISPEAPHSGTSNKTLGAPHSDAGNNYKTQESKRRKLIEQSLDKGLGSCLLKYPDVAEKVIAAWKYFDNKKYDLISFVVMPNHVHVLIKTIPEFEIGKIIWSWKKFVSSYVFQNEHYVELLRKSLETKNIIPLFSRTPESKKRFIKPASECGAPSLVLWQREYWDRFIRDENHFQKAVEYIHMNPVKAGLVSKANEWQWSSLN